MKSLIYNFTASILFTIFINILVEITLYISVIIFLFLFFVFIFHEYYSEKIANNKRNIQNKMVNNRLSYILKNNNSTIYRIQYPHLNISYVSDNINNIIGIQVPIFSNYKEWLRYVEKPVFRQIVKKFNQNIKDKNDVFVIEYPVVIEGSTIWIEDKVRIIKDDNGKITELIINQFNINKQKTYNNKLILYKNLYNNVNEGIIICAQNGSIIDINTAFTDIFGYTKEDIFNKSINIETILSNSMKLNDLVDQLNKNNVCIESVNVKKNGEYFNQKLKISCIKNKSVVSHIILMVSDITEQKNNEEELIKIAHYDKLTNLPNRNLINIHIDNYISGFKKDINKFGIMFIDFDDFKKINEKFSIEIGDQFIVQMSYNITKNLHENEVIGRFNGDEFIIIIPNLDSSKKLIDRSKEILNFINNSIYINGFEIKCSASIGLAYYDDSCVDVSSDQLIRRADKAMYSAKIKGKDSYFLFDNDNEINQIILNKELEEIDQSIKNNDFVLYYQPKVNMKTGKMIGLEALIRWNHPIKGFLAPYAFLPKIYNHPLDIKLGEWVIENAIIQIEKWKKIGLNTCVSVNVSGYHLQHENFLHFIRSMVKKYPNVSPNQIELEVLESTDISDIIKTSNVISECNKIGIKVSLDDFGTGYSSLLFLKKIPADTLKIDRSFVNDMLDDPSDLAILEGIIGLANAFSRNIIAEGVETEEHGSMLIQLGCEVAQGFFIARPMHSDNVIEWLGEWKSSDIWKKINRTCDKNLKILQFIVEFKNIYKTVIDLNEKDVNINNIIKLINKISLFINSNDIENKYHSFLENLIKNLDNVVKILSKELINDLDVMKINDIFQKEIITINKVLKEI